MLHASNVYYFLISFLFFFLSPGIGLAQGDLRISASFNDKPLPEALSEIQKEYPVWFSYDYDLLNKEKVTVQFSDLNLERAMRELTRGKALKFEIRSQKYVLIKKSETLDPDTLRVIPKLTVCGMVRDKLSGDTLRGATVRLKVSGTGSVVDSNGRFYLSALHQKKEALHISCVGYEDLNFPFSAPGNYPCIEFGLQRQNFILNQVTISDSSRAKFVERDSLSRILSFRPERFAVSPGWGEPEVMRTLQIQAGVTNVGHNAASLSIKGGSPDQNLIQIDNIPLYKPGRLLGLTDAINPYMVQSVEMESQGVGASVGGRSAAVINISSKGNLRDTSFHAGAGANLYHAFAFVEAPVVKKKLSISLGGRMTHSRPPEDRRYPDLLVQLFQNGRIVDSRELRADTLAKVKWVPSINYSDYNGKLIFSPKSDQVISFSYFKNSENIDYRYELRFDPFYLFRSRDSVDTQNEGFGLTWKGEIWNNIQTDYSLTWSRYQNHYAFHASWDRDFETEYYHEQNNRLIDKSLRMNHRRRIDRRTEVGFGYQLFLYDNIISETDSNGVNRLVNWQFDADAERSLHNVFGEMDRTFANGLRMVAGLRAGYYRTTQSFFVEPRLFVLYKMFRDRLRLTASIDRNYQVVYQPLDWTSPGLSENSWLLAGNDLPLQRGWRSHLGGYADLWGFGMAVEAYFKYNDQLAALNLGLSPDYNSPWITGGKSYALGWTATLNKKIGVLALYFAWTNGKARHIFDELNLGRSFPAVQDIRHNLNLGGVLSYGQFDFSLNAHYRSGAPWSMPDTIYTKSCPDCFQKRTSFLGYERLNTERLPDVFRIDLSIVWKMIRPKWYLRIGLSGHNLYNRSVILGREFFLQLPQRQFPQNGVQQAIDRQSAGFTPNLNLRFGF